VDSRGPRKHALDGGAHWRNLANTTEPSMCGGDAAFCLYLDHLLLLTLNVDSSDVRMVGAALLVCITGGEVSSSGEATKTSSEEKRHHHNEHEHDPPVTTDLHSSSTTAQSTSRRDPRTGIILLLKSQVSSRMCQ